MESPPPSRNSRIGFYEEPRVHEFSDAPDSPVTRRLPVSPLAREAPLKSPLATPTPPPAAPVEPQIAPIVAPPAETSQSSESSETSDGITDDKDKVDTIDQPEQKIETQVEEADSSVDQSETQDITPRDAENTKTPDLVVEENGKFSVQSSQDEVSQPADTSQKSEDEEQKTAKSTSRAQSATSSWSVTESHTDEYKVFFIFKY